LAHFVVAKLLRCRNGVPVELPPAETKEVPAACVPVKTKGSNCCDSSDKEAATAETPLSGQGRSKKKGKKGSLNKLTFID
jgi:hypothetical protein